MNISTRGRYAMRALSRLAEVYEKEPGKLTSIKDIVAREKISARYLENIFVKLRKCGILHSTKGEKGGFRLAKAPNAVSLYDILNCVENEMAPSECVVNTKVCGHSQNCGMRKIWVKLDSHINQFLKGTTLEEVKESYINGKGR